MRKVFGIITKANKKCSVIYCGHPEREELKETYRYHITRSPTCKTAIQCPIQFSLVENMS